MNKINKLAESLDKGLAKVFGFIPTPSSKEPQEIAPTAPVVTKQKPGFFKSTFRNEKRLGIEAYMTAGTDAEKAAALDGISTDLK